MRAALLLSLLASCGVAVADESRPNEARTRYERGTALYDLGRYRDAAREYEAAFELKNEPELLFNIGQAYRFAGAHGDALRAYRSYLRRTPNAPNRAEVEAQIAKLQVLLEEQENTSPQPAAVSSHPAPSRAAEAPPSAARGVATTPTRNGVTARPVYKRWWVWTVVGGIGVAGLAVGLGVGLGSRDPLGRTLADFGPGAK